jgi:hypothetical protein
MQTMLVKFSNSFPLELLLVQQLQHTLAFQQGSGEFDLRREGIVDGDDGKAKSLGYV